MVSLGSDFDEDEDEYPGFENTAYEKCTLGEIHNLLEAVEIMYKFEKPLSAIDLRTDLMYLPADFCQLSLSAATSIYQVIDEDYRKWDLEIKPTGTDSGEYLLTKGWLHFMTINKYVEGETIVFGVIGEQSDMIFVQRKHKTGPWCNYNV